MNYNKLKYDRKGNKHFERIGFWEVLYKNTFLWKKRIREQDFEIPN